MTTEYFLLIKINFFNKELHQFIPFKPLINTSFMPSLKSLKVEIVNANKRVPTLP